MQMQRKDIETAYLIVSTLVPVLCAGPMTRITMMMMMRKNNVYEMRNM